MHELFNIDDGNGSKGEKIRFVKHANNKIAAKFIVSPGNDSVVGTRA